MILSTVALASSVVVVVLPALSRAVTDTLRAVASIAPAAIAKLAVHVARAEKHVVGLEVAVNHVHAMGGLQGRADLAGDVERGPLGHASPAQARGDIAS